MYVIELGMLRWDTSIKVKELPECSETLPWKHFPNDTDDNNSQILEAFWI